MINKIFSTQKKLFLVYNSIIKNLYKLWQNYSLKNIDLDKAAAIENDETMIINSDHSIITTPIEGPQTSVGKALHSLKVESDEPGTSDTSSSDAAVGDKNKRHRQKARSESNRSEKYAKIIFLSFVVSVWFPVQLGVH